ncbi:MAG: DegV family protein [Firmicutes bacterium]|nr:DegV family protein [Bacillota bacterium]
MKFTLTTDTACDVFRSELDGLNVPWIPLTYTVKGETSEDNFDSDAQYQAFYDLLKSGAMPTTSQINSFAHAEFFENILAADKTVPIVHLTLSGGLSETVNSARIAAAEVMEKISGAQIYIVDTLSATQGHNHILKEGLRLRDTQVEGADAAKQLADFAGRIHHWFMVDDLHHLKRGGRVSGASAVIGTLLKIKPVLIINHEGKLAVVKKAHGVAKAMNFILDMVAQHKADFSSGEFIVVNANAHENAKELGRRLAEKYPECPVSIGWIGPIIGAHTGSGVFGVTFLGRENSRLTDK